MSWRQEWMWVNAKQTSFMCRGRGSITSYVTTLVEILATCFKLLKKSCIYVMFMCINALRMSIYICVWCRYQCVHVFAVHTWQGKKDETRSSPKITRTSDETARVETSPRPSAVHHMFVCVLPTNSAHLCFNKICRCWCCFLLLFAFLLKCAVFRGYRKSCY